MKKFISLLLLLAVLLSLAACGKEPQKTEILPIDSEETVPEGMKEGYVREKIQLPEGFNTDMIFLRSHTCCGDTLYFSAEPLSLSKIFGYDTVNDKWTEFMPELGNVGNADINLAAAGKSLWALLQEKESYEEIVNNIKRDMGRYLWHMNTETGEQTLTRITFEAGAWTSSEASGEYTDFTGFFAVDDERAVLVSPDTMYVVDVNGEVLEEKANPDIMSPVFYHKTVPYFWAGDGFKALDLQTLTLTGSPLPEKRYIISNSEDIYFDNKEAQEIYKLKDGKDIAFLDYMEGAESLQGSYVDMGFVNSEGYFFMVNTDGVFKFKEGLIPDRKPIKLLTIGGINEYDGEKFAYLPMEMQDAIIRFNNTDPEFKVVIEPVYPESEADRTRILMELAEREDIDLIDTSSLSDGAVDSSLLLDMLPYLDKDEDISREDFIPNLFNLMLKDGGLYEYTDKFAILTVTTHEELFPGKDEWTVEKMQSIMAEHSDIGPTWHRYDWEYLTNLFAWAATAEFIDYDNRSCDFNSEAFIHWLELIKSMPDGEEWDESDPPKLFDFNFDFTGIEPGWSNRYILKGDYAVAGFPESRGCGSYFLKLGSSPADMRTTSGENVRLGIMASGQNHEGAWRFIKCFMQGGSSNLLELSTGIPVNRDLFDAAIENELNKKHVAAPGTNIEPFNEKDAEIYRELVYSCDKMCISDEGLINIITTEITNYLDGKFDAEGAAEQIQSRVSIYLSEQG